MARPRPVAEWLRALSGPEAPLGASLRRAHDGAPYLLDLLAVYRAVLERFAGRYGDREPVFLVRAPARVNLLGMHIDHRGGSINPIAVRDMVMAVTPRDDDRVEAANVDAASFPDGAFSIAAELPQGTLNDWEAWTRQALRARAGEDPRLNWLNYLRAATHYLEYRRRRLAPAAPPLRGMNVCVGSTLPIASGLSSSSALVVCAMLAAMAVNGIEIDRHALVDVCGEAEWFVGTRGGQGDHASILFGRPGSILHIGFWPVRVEAVPLPKGYRVVLANSLKEAKKQVGARDAFNQRVTGYVIAFHLLRQAFPRHAAAIQHLRDVNPTTLGVTEADIYRMLLALPVRASRADVDRMLSDPAARDQLGAMYETHAEPTEGYAVRGVALYCISECLRSELAPARLRVGDVAGFGELMNLSHEGDRVTRWVNGESGGSLSAPGAASSAHAPLAVGKDPAGQDRPGHTRDGKPSMLAPGSRRVPVDHTLDDEAVERLIAAAEAGDPAVALWRQPGGYDASCPELDELVDIARALPGVLGAGLVGAGLGGSVAILAREEAVEALTSALAGRYYAPRRLAPAVEVCVPVEGASVIDI